MTENKQIIPMISEEVVIEQEQQIVRAKNNQLAERDTSNWIDLGWFHVWNFSGIIRGFGNFARFNIDKKIMKKKLTTDDEVQVRSIMFPPEVAEESFGLETNQLKQLGYKYYIIKVRDRKGVSISPSECNNSTSVCNCHCLVINKKSEDIFMKET